MALADHGGSVQGKFHRAEQHFSSRRAQDSKSTPVILDKAHSGRTFFEQRYRKLGGSIVPISLPSCIRWNPLKLDRAAFEQRLASINMNIARVPFTKNGYVVKDSPVSPGASAEHFLGYYYVQEAASQLPIQVLNPKPGDLVLDACAAPGGKTTQLSEWMQNKGRIVSLDKKAHRIPSLLHNIERMQTGNVMVYCMDAAQVGQLQLMFDKALVDAPCAGNYAADPEWFQKRDLAGIEQSAAIQRRILAEVFKVIKPGGILVYSTCSLEPEENELNMQWLYARGNVAFEETGLRVGDPGLTNIFGKTLHAGIAKCRRFWPHKTKTQGFFVARIRRT